MSYIFAILLVIYCISALFVYIGVRQEYSKGGHNYGKNPGWIEVVAVFCPILNTALVILVFNLSKFFCIKK